MSEIINCPACKNEISVNAVTCPKCGEPLKEVSTPNKVIVVNTKSNLIAAIFSFFIPGLGQVYLGSTLIGILCFFFMVVIYVLLFWTVFVPLIPHLIIVIDAAVRKPNDIQVSSNGSIDSEQGQGKSSLSSKLLFGSIVISILLGAIGYFAKDFSKKYNDSLKQGKEKLEKSMKKNKSS